MKTIKKLFLSVLLAYLGLTKNEGFTEEIPTLDFSNCHDYSLLETDGISVSPRNQRSSQSILNKKFKISLGEGKIISIGSETNQPMNSWAVVWCPPGETNLQFLALGSGYLTPEETKKLLRQIRIAFGWLEDDFEKQINSPNKFQKWLKINKTNSPFYTVEVGTTHLKETPYYINMTLAWDANIIEKQFPGANKTPREKFQEIQQQLKSQSNSPSAWAR